MSDCDREFKIHAMIDTPTPTATRTDAQALRQRFEEVLADE